MNAALYNFAIRFSANTSAAAGGMGRLNAKLAALGNTFSSVQRRQQHLIDGSRKLGETGRWMFTRLTLPVVALGTAFVNTHGKMESWRISFRTVIGDIKKADALFNKAYEFSAATPFTTEAVIRRTQALIGSGMTDPVGWLSRMGDIASGVGRANDAGLTDISRAAVKAHEKSRLDMESLEPYLTVGAGVTATMVKLGGFKNKEGLYKAMEKGLVHSDLLFQGIRQMTEEGGRFYKAMEEQAKGILVSWAEIKSRFFGFADALGETIVRLFAVHAGMKRLSEFLTTARTDVQDWLKNAGPIAKWTARIGLGFMILAPVLAIITAAIVGFAAKLIVGVGVLKLFFARGKLAAAAQGLAAAASAGSAKAVGGLATAATAADRRPVRPRPRSRRAHRRRPDWQCRRWRRSRGRFNRRPQIADEWRLPKRRSPQIQIPPRAPHPFPKPPRPSQPFWARHRRQNDSGRHVPLWQRGSRRRQASPSRRLPSSPPKLPPSPQSHRRNGLAV